MPTLTPMPMLTTTIMDQEVTGNSTACSCAKMGHFKPYSISRQRSQTKENGGLTQGSPDMINMKLPGPTTETKMMTLTGSNMNRTLCKYCLVEIFVQTLTQSQTFSLMKLMVKEFNMCLLT